MTKEDLTLLIKEEGDFYEWINKNIHCHIQRNSYLGSWCGYIKIPNSFSMNFNDIYLNCHGGVTYQSSDGDYTTIGFDCGHNGDLIPYMFLDKYEMFGDGYSVYRNKEYVISEVISMVEQVLQIRSVQRGIKIDNILDCK